MASEPVHASEEPRNAGAAQNLQSQIWQDYRPYLRVIAKDTLVCGTLYFALLIFDWMVIILPTHGWEGEFIPHLHGIAVLTIFAVFSWLSIIDIYRIHRDVTK